MVKIIRGDPNVYELVDHEGEPIIGKLIVEKEKVESRKSSRGRKCEARRWFWPSGLATVVSITAGSQRVTSKTYRSIYSGRRIR